MIEFSELNDDNENDLEKNFEEDKKDININDLLNTKISYKTKAMDIESILNALKRGDYVLPKYQRKYVWEKFDASNLVLSLIKNIPIPPIYLYFDYNTGKYVVLDGQQRITTLFMYYNNIFYKSKNGRIKIDFKDISYELEKIEYYTNKIHNPIESLSNKDIKKNEDEIKKIYKNIEKKYNIVKSKFNLELDDYEKDITFSNFDEKAKRILRRKDLDTVFVQCESKNTDKAYSEIFKLLNSAGKELSSQEIRNGVYYNNVLYDYLFNFNKENIIWRKIYGAESLIYKDFEYLLRFLALDYFSEYKEGNFIINYNKAFSYSNIIDDYSEKFNRELACNNFEEIEKKVLNDIQKLKMFFEKFTDIDESTKMTGKNLLVLEAMFIAFSKLNLLGKGLEISYFDMIDYINKDANVQKYTAQSTSSKGNVINRIDQIMSLIRGKALI
ncbi:DUF262 domain-containing protein [Terrisporobacter glycolicus]|nr:DUF262 domain-containing protein [Terrisporobacter glycolicus]